MVRLLLFPVVLLLASGPFGATPQADETLVFVLSGQSNMVGQGVVAELPDDLREVPANVRFFLNGEPTTFAAQERFGPEVTFAHTLSAAYPGKSIVLIKFAVGGSSLLAWAPDWDPAAAALTGNEGQGPLYRTLMGHVATSRAALAAGDEPGGRLAALLWMQGERDARFEAAGAQYAANFAALVARFRADLDAPDLPFLFGQVNPPAQRYPAVTAVREAQAAAARSIAGATMISTEGISKRADDLHYDSAGQLELGRRFARAYLEIAGRGAAR